MKANARMLEEYAQYGTRQKKTLNPKPSHQRKLKNTVNHGVNGIGELAYQKKESVRIV